MNKSAVLFVKNNTLRNKLESIFSSIGVATDALSTSDPINSSLCENNSLFYFYIESASDSRFLDSVKKLNKNSTCVAILPTNNPTGSAYISSAADDIFKENELSIASRLQLHCKIAGVPFTRDRLLNYEDFILESADPIFVLDDKGSIIQENNSAKEFFSLIALTEFQKDLNSLFGLSFHNLKSDTPCSVSISLDSSNSPLLLELNLTKIAENPDLYLLAVLDSSESHSDRKELNTLELIAYDDLTKVYRRAHFMSELSSMLASNSESMSGALVFVDLDDFKIVNDKGGHAAGDFVLQQTAARIKSILRSRDIVGRYGGDEFVLFIKNFNTVQNLEKLLERLISVCCQPVIYNDTYFSISLSIGVALYPYNSESIDDLIYKADSSMYFAKESGKNKFALFEDSHVNLKEKTKEEADFLLTALEQNQIYFRYQPIISTKNESNKIVAFEALMRWNHPERGELSFTELEKLVCDNSVALKAGTILLKEAFFSAKVLQRRGFSGKLHINIFDIQFDRSLPALISDFALISGVSPEYIALEINESALINNRHSFSIIKELSDIGISVYLDEFGSKSSTSILNLPKLGLTGIKVNLSAIPDVDSDSFHNIYSSIASSFNLSIIAKNTESEFQHSQISKYNYDCYQGFISGSLLTLPELVVTSKANFDLILNPYLN